METINNVTFLYTNIQVPKNKYQSEEKEFSVQCVVSKEEAKAWNKKFPKQKAKSFDNEEFVEKFEIPLPFPSQEEQFTIKIARAATYKDGNPIDPKYAPKVYLQVAKGKVSDITKTKLVANGSKGKVACDVVSNDFGTFAKLNCICVENLIEYVPPCSNPFGDVVEDAEDTQKREVFEQEDNVGKKPAKPKTPSKPVVEQEEDELDDSELPF